MNRTRSDWITPERRRVGGLVLLCLALFFLRLGGFALWDIDEGMHASTSKIMVQSGDWLYPVYNGEPFYDKPPLYNWFVALSFVVFGFTEFAARLPSALLGLGTVLLTYRFGRRMLGAEAAFLGAAVLATSLEFVVLSRAVVHDISLTCFVALALFAFYRAHAEEAHRARYLVIGYVATGFAVLAKGPLGAVLVGGVVVPYLLLRREPRFVLEMMPLRGALIAAAIAVPPYLAMGLRDPDYLRYFFIEKNLGSFASAASAHPEPFWYFLPWLLVGFLPWSWFLPLTLGRLLRRPRSLGPARLYLLIWCGFVFLFFSAATSKLSTYILPLFPALALLIGELWARVLEGPDRRLRRWLVVSHLFLVAIVGWVVVTLWRESTGHQQFDAEVHGPHVKVLIAAFSATVLICSYAMWRGRYRLYFGTTAALMVALIAHLGLFLGPAMEPYRSTKRIALTVDRMLPPGEKMVFYHRVKDTAPFYNDRQGIALWGLDKLEEYLSRPGAICIVNTKWRELLGEVRVPYRVVEEHGAHLIVEGLGVEPTGDDQ
jgi:4-amino-4-deoxy-L-arabinose transferase-like glycosyltransferase